MPQKKVPITLDDATVRALVLQDGKADDVWFDKTLSGFGVRLRGSSDQTRKVWIIQYRRGPKNSTRMRLGEVEKLTAKQARKLAQEHLAKVLLGGDPQGEKRNTRVEAKVTLAAVAERYLEAKQETLRPASLKVARLYLLGPYFKPLHGMAVTRVLLSDVAARLTAITSKHGSVTAGAARTALSSLFKWAMGEGLCLVDPVVGSNTPRGPAKRDRVLSDPELANIWRASGDDDGGRITRLLILLAARRAEIGGLRWSELNLEAGTWTLPPARSKNKHAHTLPLPDAALAIIETVPRIEGRDNLFGERSGTGFSGWSRLKSALDETLGDVAAWTLHDIRRSTATKLGDLGTPPHVIETILNHRGGFRVGVSGVYNRSSYEREVRAALAMWSDHVRVMVEGGERKVIAFRPADATA